MSVIFVYYMAYCITVFNIVNHQEEDIKFTWGQIPEPSPCKLPKVYYHSIVKTIAYIHAPTR